MISDYPVEGCGSSCLFIGDPNGLVLQVITNDMPYDLHRVGFSYRTSANRPVLTTARELCGDDSYDAGFLENLGSIRSDAVYVEVGAGLGALSPHIADNGGNVVIIDPFGYAEALKMLRFARTQDLGEARRRVDQLIGRASKIMNSPRIRLVNKTLHEALLNNPELLGAADFVIDNCGASLYGHQYGFTPDATLDLESRLLKDGSKLLVSVGMGARVYENCSLAGAGR